MGKPKKSAETDKVKRAPARWSGKAPLLLEIGVEELPYQFIVPALSALKESAERLLREQRLTFETARTVGTPRRLTLVVDGLAARQTSIVKEFVGPPKAVAFDQSGHPTKAAMSFAAAQDVAVQDLQVRHTAKGDYLLAVKHEAGRPAKVVLGELLPHLVASLPFPKAMKWNETGIRFARPLRWLVVLYDGTVLPVQAAGIQAGNKTRGHRVLSSEKAIVVRDYESYVKGLERQGVVVDPERRRHIIKEQIAALCKKTGFRLNEDADLLDQAVYTTEYPTAIIGSFKETFLDVPQEILMTSMKKHQGFFSVRDKRSGKLAPHFIAVANNQPKDMSLIRAGNERVLAARLADAKFFFDEDRKTNLAERAGRLSGVIFYQKLGTMAQKQERVRKLAEAIVSQLDPKNDELKRACERAAGLCKADLVSGIVGEFPELQGIMGSEYARYDGESEAVSQAIREQYLPRALEGELPVTRLGQVLSLADRLDSIASFFHVGMIPTGSEDPYALRRHATAVVRIILEGNLRTNLGKVIDHACNIVSQEGIKGVSDASQQGRGRIAEFIFERVRHYGRTVFGLRDDVMEAILRTASDSMLDLVDLLFKMKALQAVTMRPEFDLLIVGFKRASRIVAKEQWNRKPVDPVLFRDSAEAELHQQAGTCRKEFEARMAEERYDKALEELVRLKPAIDAFFEAVMVNADDEAVRSNRLSLLKEVDEMFMSFADFSQIVVQGS
jgi:glycyl-tRNA synthetase beta chain